jgi:tetratricopeptide (TPR) repeat protein
MILRIAKTAFAGVALLALQACQDKTAAGPDAAATEAAPTTATTAKAPDGAFAPQGTEGATITVRPAGDAEVTAADGRPGRVKSAPGSGEYDRILLLPGEHVLHVVHSSAGAGLDLRFEASAGEFFAAGIDYLFEGQRFWAPVIVQGAPDGTVVAAKDEALVGKSVADARWLILAELAEASKAKATEPQSEPQTDAREEAASRFENGRALFEDRKYPEALAAFDSVLAILPGLDVGHLYRGLTLMQLKRRQEALAAFDAAVAAGRKHREPNDRWFALPHYQRGLILVSMGRPDAAEKAFSDSIAAEPTHSALAGRGNLYFVRGQALGNQEKWDEAEPWFRDAQADAEAGILVAPQDTKLWSLKTATHIMLNEHKDACKSMRKACELGNCTILEQFPQCKPGGS